MKRRNFLAGLGGATMMSNTAEAESSDTQMFMPPEWAPHQACVMTWCSAESFYGEELVTWIRNDQVRIAEAISRFEPVVMLASAKDVPEAAQRLGKSAEVFEIPCFDTWARDTLPTMSRGHAGELNGTIWNFNVWGEKFEGYGADRALAARFSGAFDVEARTAPIIAEGGALETDGLGTIVTTETCLLNPNRNPGMSKSDVEQALKEYAPGAHVLWLWGSEQDTITDGHIDGIMRFIEPGLVVAEIIDDSEDPEFHDLQENLKQLRAARDARGERFEVAVIKRPRWDSMPERGLDFSASYVNAYFPNGGIVMPSFGDPDRDSEAANTFAGLEPTRKIVQIPIDAIAEGGGGIHCCTMQIPA
ncbi:MAG: agmatine deiminase family protein [Pseudomonadota bacterium]